MLLLLSIGNDVLLFFLFLLDHLFFSVAIVIAVAFDIVTLVASFGLVVVADNISVGISFGRYGSILIRLWYSQVFTLGIVVWLRCCGPCCCSLNWSFYLSVLSNNILYLLIRLFLEYLLQQLFKKVCGLKIRAQSLPKLYSNLLFLLIMMLTVLC